MWTELHLQRFSTLIQSNIYEDTDKYNKYIYIYILRYPLRISTLLIFRDQHNIHIIVLCAGAKAAVIIESLEKPFY